MFGFFSRAFASHRQARLALAALAGFGALCLFAALSLRECAQDAGLEDERRAQALAQCQAGASDGGVFECAQRLEDNHSACYRRFRFVDGNRFQRGYFDRQSYERCVQIGVSDFFEERRASRHQRDGERRRLLQGR